MRKERRRREKQTEMEWVMMILTEACMVVNKISMMMDRKLMEILMKMNIMMMKRKMKMKKRKMKMELIAVQKRRKELKGQIIKNN
jgi:NADH:ubiquinone oxidoreductase subunit K